MIKRRIDRSLGAVHTHTHTYTGNFINKKDYVLSNVVLLSGLQKYKKVDRNIMSVAILDTG